jgi:hypothetical protein
MPIRNKKVEDMNAGMSDLRGEAMVLGGILLFVVARSALGCGMTTHDEIAERSVHQINRAQYPELFGVMRGHPDERDGGSIFPDWGYATANEELSWVAHGESFRQTREGLVQQRFPPRRTRLPGIESRAKPSPRRQPPSTPADWNLTRRFHCKKEIVVQEKEEAS